MRCSGLARSRLALLTSSSTETYGEAIDAEKLIPHMLEAFIAGDRGFKKGGAGKVTPQKPS